MQIVVGQRHIGGLHGDVGSGQAHRDSDIGGGQCRASLMPSPTMPTT
ncbi:heavy metal translocating P-type ATPase domain protein [Mycobacterium ulcerans str. Harvey]|uniref:Heavy metal translocating P-type ATPase domain protein n=1 Tax=Mycobacterium ulcerans str. Harvey TaxID=1299332 RepID=A0ABP3AQ66_MYCUL|nr:heavy metal translocating P-type ATPase domain protein [Mycobacterium ulcerans str. Harvey]